MVTHVEVVGVHLWGRLVGALSFDAGAGCYAFEYDPAWRRDGVEIAPLQMPLGSRQRIFRFPQLSRMTYNGLPGAIADALPDAFGNALIDRWMRDRGIEAEAITPLDRLSYMGSRAMGALEFRPAQERAVTRTLTGWSKSREPAPRQNPVPAAPTRDTRARSISG